MNVLLILLGLLVIVSGWFYSFGEMMSDAVVSRPESGCLVSILGLALLIAGICL